MSSQLYVIFERGSAHPMVYLSRAPSATEAVAAYLQQEIDWLEVRPDGSVRCQGGEDYPHVLAAIEAECKRFGEWQIRVLPEGAEQAPLTEAFCGEDPSDVEYHLQRCRPLLRQTHPRSRAPGFIWYLRNGVMVVFFKKTRRGGMEVLARFVRRRDWPGLEYRPWSGTYEDLIEDLYLGRAGASSCSTMPAHERAPDR